MSVAQKNTTMTTFSLLLSFTLLSSTLIAQSLSQAIAFYKNGEPAKAQRLFKSVPDKSNSFAEAQYYLGRMAFDEEDYDAAEEYFEEAIEKDDNNSDYHLWLGNTLGTIAQNANVFKQGMLAPKIKREFERAVELNNRNQDALWGLLQYYVQAPGIMGGSYEKGLEVAEKLGKISKVQGHSARSTVYAAQEKFDLVEKEYKLAASVDPAWNMNLGFFYQQRGQYDQAFETFENLTTDENLKWAALYQVGKTSALSGKNIDRGIACLEMYLTHTPSKNQPSHAGAKMRLGMIYEKAGEKVKAREYYRQSLSEDPDMKEAKAGLERLGK